MEGVDFHDTFAPIEVKRDWIIHHLDVNNAFLHGNLEEDIYMKIPRCFRKENENEFTSQRSLCTA